MNNLKRGLGYVWMVLGPAVMIFMFWQAADKISLAQAKVALVSGEALKEAARSAAINTILQWCIIIAVFLPIACGLVIFGKYAIKGEYDDMPMNPAALTG